MKKEITINTKTNGGVRRKSYSHRKLDARIERRKDDADLRNEQYRALSLKEKIDLVEMRSGSVRELARLNKQLEASGGAKPTTSKPKKAKVVKVNQN